MFYTNNQTDRHQDLFTSDVAHQDSINIQQTKQPQTVYITSSISKLPHLLESKSQKYCDHLRSRTNLFINCDYKM